MSINQGIDIEEVIKIESKPKMRVLAIWLEAIPLMVGIVCYLLGTDNLVGYMYILISAIYILAGSYVFKTDKYRVGDAIFILFSSIVFIFPSISSFISIVYFWPGATEILTA